MGLEKIYENLSYELAIDIKKIQVQDLLSDCDNLERKFKLKYKKALKLKNRNNFLLISSLNKIFVDGNISKNKIKSLTEIKDIFYKDLAKHKLARANDAADKMVHILHQRAANDNEYIEKLLKYRCRVNHLEHYGDLLEAAKNNSELKGVLDEAVKKIKTDSAKYNEKKFTVPKEGDLTKEVTTIPSELSEYAEGLTNEEVINAINKYNEIAEKINAANADFDKAYATFKEIGTPSKEQAETWFNAVSDHRRAIAGLEDKLKEAKQLITESKKKYYAGITKAEKAKEEAYIKAAYEAKIMEGAAKIVGAYIILNDFNTEAVGNSGYINKTNGLDERTSLAMANGLLEKIITDNKYTEDEIKDIKTEAHSILKAGNIKNNYNVQDGDKDFDSVWKTRYSKKSKECAKSAVQRVGKAVNIIINTEKYNDKTIEEMNPEELTKFRDEVRTNHIDHIRHAISANDPVINDIIFKGLSKLPFEESVTRDPDLLLAKIYEIAESKM